MQAILASLFGSTHIREIDSEKEWAHQLGKHSLVVVKVGTPDCRPCKTIMPTFDAAIGSRKGSVKGLSIDANGPLAALCDIWDVGNYPTFLFFRKGQRVPALTLVGAQPAELASRIKNFS